MKRIFKKIIESHPVSLLLDLLQSENRFINVSGLAGALGSFIAAGILEQTRCSLLLVAPGPARAEAALDDLVSILGPEKVGFLPPYFQYATRVGHQAIGPRNERVEALMRLQRGIPTILVTQPETLLERNPDRTWVDDHIVRLTVGEGCGRDELITGLFDTNYRRETLVDAQGQFAVRGGLLDVFPFGHENPLRIEFDGDTIESMRRFDPVTQRSVEPVDDASFLMGDESDSDRGGLLNLLPDDTVIFWHDLVEIEARTERFLLRIENSVNRSAETESTDSSLAYQSLQDVISDAREYFRQVIWQGTIQGTASRSSAHNWVDFGARQPDPFPPGLDQLTDYLQSYMDKDLTVWVAADTEAEKRRLSELLSDSGLDDVMTLTPSISGGFTSSDIGITLLATHELFDRRRLRSRHTRFRRRKLHFDRTALRKGDLVVHTQCGIGMYEGMQTVKVRGQPRECLRIKYQDDVLLFVRVENFGLVEKYVGSESARPRLSRLGGTDWARAKKRTRKALHDMADELIRLYAQRKVIKGRAYPEDTYWQKEMEASFEFEDTPDQVDSTVAVKQDLEAINPMDRLLCGDVGFGKTEIAVRASFKVVQDSFQAAVLVPTTILAQQHLETFRDRLAAYPVKIDVLSRFKTPSQQRETIEGLKSGRIDIVIGTHRLLSRDVAFRRLGLVIIDEEHRFGVRHKERLKQLKTNVDVLTLTATPIPRTLHLALMGARDTSLINTPPVDRLPVQTDIYPWSEELIRDAILREVDRQGQVFFVHNRVQSIHAVKALLERLVPGIRYAVAHGQMKESVLERVISDFLRHRYDVLVTTMIIESGIDMPNVNTLIVNRSDRFGLAQLYQLRGRIGRSNRQAYAYLLTAPKLAMTPEARRRLATISELTELGSGMKVAMRDLEIRGAGNLLGAQQSGYINAVGFDMYSRLLNGEVSKLKDEPPVSPPPTDEEIRIDYDGPALLPADYIDDGDIRYDFYRRLSAAEKVEEVDRLGEELLDRFGVLPERARNLLELTRLKILCRIADFTRLVVEDEYLIASLNLPEEVNESQREVGRLVAAADPERVEFRVTEGVEMIYRFNSDERLIRTRKFLQRITREGILKD